MNNNRKTISVCSIIALLVLAVVIIITIMNDLIQFSIILGGLFIVLTVCLAIYLREAPDEYSIFIKEKKKILRTYDSVIVEVEEIPNIAGKNIIKVKTIDDLVDAQLELREPIYYKNDNDSCFFLLLHYNEACIYILKINDSVISPTEQSIRYMKKDAKAKKQEEDNNILENVENTIVYKLDELRSFKISPIRNETEIEIVDDTAIKEEIEKDDITTNDLESEISKTMYIKNLKEKIAEAEAKESEEEKIKQEEQAKQQKEEKAVAKQKSTKTAKPVTQPHATKPASRYKNKKQ